MLSNKSLLKKGSIIQRLHKTKYSLYLFYVHFDKDFGISNVNTIYEHYLEMSTSLQLDFRRKQ